MFSQHSGYCCKHIDIENIPIRTLWLSAAAAATALSLSLSLSVALAVCAVLEVYYLKHWTFPSLSRLIHGIGTHIRERQQAREAFKI
jgi:hypothetical protein